MDAVLLDTDVFSFLSKPSDSRAELYRPYVKGPVTGSDPYQVGYAWFAVPLVGNYANSTWSSDGKVFTIVFAGRTYKEPPRSFKYELLRKTSSAARILSPSEMPTPYSCPNGELLVDGVRKCRPN